MVFSYVEVTDEEPASRWSHILTSNIVAIGSLGGSPTLTEKSNFGGHDIRLHESHGGRGRYSDASGSSRPTGLKFSARRTFKPVSRLASKVGNFSRVERWQNTLWLGEICSCTFALGFLIAIVGILVVHDGKPMPKWPTLISINTLVAIFTSVLKAAMLFPVAEALSELKWMHFGASQPASDFDRYDRATRGPWGALLLVANPKRRRNLLTWLGALITILALSVEPFTQQVLHYDSCQVPLDGGPSSVALIPRLNVYGGYGKLIGEQSWTIDPAMNVAIYTGLLKPPANASSSIASVCSSGNCTFSESTTMPYTSIAVCTSVQNITDQILPNSTAGNWTLPSGANSNLNTRLMSIAISQSNDNNTTASFPLLAFDAIMTVCEIGNSGACDPGPQSTPLAFRSSIYPCINTYDDATVSNSVFRERIISSVPLPETSGEEYGPHHYSLAGNYPTMPGVDCTPSSTQTGSKTVPAGRTDTGQYFTSDEFGPFNITDAVYFDPSCVYVLKTESAQSISTKLGSFFQDGDHIFLTEDFYQTNGSDWLQEIYNGGNANMDSVSKFMNGIANAMTAEMRIWNSSDDSYSGHFVRGTVLDTQTCVSVMWPWLALPASLLVASLLLVIAMAVKSTRQLHQGRGTRDGRRPWKSSSMPLLWCELDERTKSQYGVLRDVVDMRRCGDRIEVKLGVSAKGGLDQTLLVDGGGFGRKERGSWMLREKRGSGYSDG